MDLSAVPHLATLETKVPFINFFDGFRTSHEYHKIEEMDMEDIRPLVKEEFIKDFRNRALTPERPVTRGTAENPETFFTHREACNPYYDAIPEVVENYCQEMTKITGRGITSSTTMVLRMLRTSLLMGSATEPAHEAIDYLNKAGQKGWYGCSSPVSSILC